MTKANTAKEDVKQETVSQTESETTKGAEKQKPRIISNPNEVANLVMMQIDNVNTKKDDLTIALKGLTDVSKQLVRAYGENMKIIAAMQQRIKELEEKNGKQDH